MKENKNILKSPTGMKSYLPELATELKEIEKKILEIFDLWGYQAILTPTLEYLESLKIGMGNALVKKIYKFIDYEGNILALRPEMTAPIARTICANLNELELPLRLSYSSSVFRHEEPQTGKNREIYQLGVELIGAEDWAADTEGIILAIEALRNTGLKGFNIDIGHVAFLDGIIAELGLSSEMEYEIKKYLNKKDLVGLNNYIKELEIEDNEVLKEIPLLRGSVEVLEKARGLVNNQDSIEALNNLLKLHDYIADYGFSDYITFDLGLIRGFDYYTGVVFEGFTEKLGYNICGGGRYDHLLEKYSGISLPAIGFAIGIERVRLALKRQGKVKKERRVENQIFYNEDCAGLALNLAKRLRSRGLVTIISSVNSTNNPVLSQKEKPVGNGSGEGLKKVFYFKDKKKLLISDLVNKKEEIINLEGDWEDRIWEI